MVSSEEINRRLNAKRGVNPPPKDDYNEKLKNAVEDWINTNREQRKSKVDKIKKYAEIKLKKESGFPNKQFRFLKDVTGKQRTRNIWRYEAPVLRLMHLLPNDFYNYYRDNVIEKLMTVGVPVIFPKMEQQTINKAGQGAVAGGLLFGLAGAAVGSILGASDKQVIETTVPGSRGTLKAAEKGIVLSSSDETLRIGWDK